MVVLKLCVKKWILERSDKRSFCLAEATGVRCSLDKEPSPIQGGPLRTIYYKAHAASENAVSAVKLSSQVLFNRELRLERNEED